MDWTMLQIADNTWITSLGWTLVHSVWQLAFVALIYSGLKFTSRKNRSTNAQRLYVFGCLGMAAMIALPAITLTLMLGHNDHKPAADRFATSMNDTPTDLSSGNGTNKLANAVESNTRNKPAETSRAANRFDSRTANSEITHDLKHNSNFNYLVLVWSIGVCLFSVRPLFGISHVRSLTRSNNKPIAATWKRIATEIAEKLKIRQAIRVVESTAVQVPTVVGYLKPVILIPTTALTGLSQHQMTLILAHELAHIRRHDFLINFGQTVVETLLFFHPAVWWLSREVRNERENCCDDIAVQMSGDATSLAHALLALEEARIAAPALAATGGSLTARIKRLMNIQPTNHPPFFGLATLALAGIISTVAISPAVQSVAQAQETTINHPNQDRHNVAELEQALKTNSAAQHLKQGNDQQNNPKVNQEPFAKILVIHTTSKESAETYRQLALDNPTKKYFKELSGEVSDDENVRRMNGEVPPVLRGAGETELEDVAFSLKRGQISKVIKIREGWVVAYGLGITYPHQEDTPKPEETEKVKTYLVADLVVSASPFMDVIPEQAEKKIDADPLVDLIKTTIEPESWPDHTMMFHEDNLSLIVSHNQHAHDQIADLLEKLREVTEVTIETRGFLISIPQKELQRFRLFPDGWNEEPKVLGIQEAATLKAIAVAKDSVQLQNLPAKVLFNGQTSHTEIDILDDQRNAQIAIRQVVSPQRDSIRSTLVVTGREQQTEPAAFDSKSGQLVAVDVSQELGLDPKQRRAILILKSDIAQDVE